MESEGKLLSTGELRVIEVLGKHGTLDTSQIGDLIGPSSIFKAGGGKTRFNLINKLKEKSLIVETQPRTSTLWDNRQFNLSDKGQQIYRLVNRIDRTWKALRKILESK